MTDVIDVTLSSNSEIICKSVSILKSIADFVNNEKKKEEQQLLKLADNKSPNKEEEKKHGKFAILLSEI